MITGMQDIAESRGPVAIRILKYWVPVAIMLAAMFYFSTDRLSNEHTETLVGKVLMWLAVYVSEPVLATVNFVVRKTAHFIEYAILGALLFRAFRADDPLRWRFKWAAYSLISAGSWAALDEFHQTFTRTRSGSPLDSLLDASGALFVLIVIAFYKRRTQDESNGSRLERRPVSKTT